MKFLLGVLLAAGLLAGCSNGDDSAGAVPSATANDSPESGGSATAEATIGSTPSAGATSSAEPTGGPSADDLLSAPVPSLCTHPAGRLVNGSLPGIRPNGGHVTIATKASDYLQAPVRADFDGDGVDEIAAIVECDKGGVAWPQVLVVYRTGPTLLGYVDLADVTKAEHSTISRLVPDGNGVTLDWDSTNGCCGDPSLSTARAVWNGSRVVLRETATLSVPGNQCPVADIEKAWKGEEQDCLEPEVLSHLFYPDFPFSSAWSTEYLQQVVFIQLKLRDLGYAVVVDGKFGSETESVVRKYQADKGFVIDGVVGAQTWKGLFGLGPA